MLIRKAKLADPRKVAFQFNDFDEVEPELNACGASWRLYVARRCSLTAGVHSSQSVSLILRM